MSKVRFHVMQFFGDLILYKVQVSITEKNDLLNNYAD